MEHKQRYCPSCGVKTNALHCEICERSTKSITYRFHEKELSLLEDDVETFDHIQDIHKPDRKIYEEPQDVHENLEDVHRNVHSHTNRQKVTRMNIEALQNYKNVFPFYKALGIVIILVLVFVSVLLNSKDLMSDHPQDKGYGSNMESFDQYLFDVSHEEEVEYEVMPMGDGTDTLVVKNPSDFYISCNLYDENDNFLYSFKYLEPHSKHRISNSPIRYETYQTKGSTSCYFEILGVYDFTFAKPSIDYQLYIEESFQDVEHEKASAVVKEQASKEQVEQLMRHLFATQFINDKTYLSDLKLYFLSLDDKNLQYSVYFDFSEEKIAFYSENGSEEWDMMDVFVSNDY